MGKLGLGPVLAVAVALTLTGCASIVQPSSPSIAPNPTHQAPEEPADEPEPEPEAVGDSMSNPFPKGEALSVTSDGEDSYTVSAKLVNGNASKAIAQENQFNDKPGKGMKYILIQYTFRGASADDSVDPALELYDYAIATPDGQLWQSASVVLPGKSMSDAPDLYKGQTYKGVEAYAVPIDETKFFVTAFGSYLAL